MERSYEIKRVSLWPVVKVTFIVLLIIGILIAIVYTVILSGLSLLVGTFDESPFGEDLGFIKGVGFLVLIPVISLAYAIFGTIAVTIWVLIYNMIASIIGGIELTLKSPDELVEQPSPGTGGAAHVPERPINGF